MHVAHAGCDIVIIESRGGLDRKYVHPPLPYPG